MQGGGEGQKDQVASEPEVRQKLHHNSSQRASHHEHQRSAQRGECKGLRMHQRPEYGCEGMTPGRATGC